MERRSELELYEALGSQVDEAVLVEFADRLRRCVWWVLNRIEAGGDLSGDVDDIVADARMRLERLRERGFTGNAREFRSYVYKAVASACIDALRTRRWTVALDAPVALPGGGERPLRDVAAELTDPAPTPAERAESSEQREVLHRALGALDPRCQQLLREFHLRGVSVRDLADRAGARTNTIEVALSRCRERLYHSYLREWIAGGEPERRERVDKASARLSGRLGGVFRAWWCDHRSVAEISRAEGIEPEETRRLLRHAKTEVWRMVGEGSA